MDLARLVLFPLISDHHGQSVLASKSLEISYLTQPKAWLLDACKKCHHELGWSFLLLFSTDRKILARVIPRSCLKKSGPQQKFVSD